MAVRGQQSKPLTSMITLWTDFLVGTGQCRSSSSEECARLRKDPPGRGQVGPLLILSWGGIAPAYSATLQLNCGPAGMVSALWTTFLVSDSLYQVSCPRLGLF
jgi:hypothetical protein